VNRISVDEFSSNGAYDVKQQTIQNYYSSKVFHNNILDKKQKEIVDIFMSLDNKRILVSAPTSFGKTFILREILFLNQERYKNVLLVFPTIALLNENTESIKELIQQEMEDSDAPPFSNRENKNLSKLNRINKFNGFISNMAFNMIGTRCYITIITSSGQKYTNWAYEGAGSDSYLNRYMPGETMDKGTNLIWKGIEKNYIESDTNLHPYVMTLVKNIYNASGEIQYGTFVISVPEDEISKLMTTENQLQKRVILNENLDVISSTVKEWLNKPFKNIYDCIFPEEQKGYFVIDDTKGNKSIISYNTIGNWKVVDIKSYDAITEQLGKVRNQLLIINAIFILAFWGISAVIARNIPKPLRKLARLCSEPTWIALTETKSVKDMTRLEFLKKTSTL
jgi:hypothetical protein